MDLAKTGKTLANAYIICSIPSTDCASLKWLLLGGSSTVLGSEKILQSFMMLINSENRLIELKIMSCLGSTWHHSMHLF